MDTSFTNSKEEIARARMDETEWSSLTRDEQVRSIELEGYVVLPDLLPLETVERIREELGRLPTRSVDYSPHQRGSQDVQWTDSPVSIEVIALAPMVEFLTHLFGDEVICTSCGYGCSEPGHPGIAIHTDAQPYGSKIFGLQSSSPVLARALYYLDDQTPDCSPFKVVPRSHLSMHIDGNPYNRFLSHPEEVMVCCKAGSAVVINQNVFHGNFPNHSARDRRMLAIAYRPCWAGPIDDVEEDRDPEKVAGLPEHIQPFFRSLNTRHIDYDVANRPDGMARDAAGIRPSRWGGGRPG
jgi:hypothetical protein